MARTSILIFFIVCVLVLVHGSLISPPKFDGTFRVSGVISLPYAEINEPFEAWIDPPGKSRVDYYGGMVITIQRADQSPQGTGYKIAPQTTETERNVKSCFQINGTDLAPVTIQSVLPSLDYFNYIGIDMYNGKICYKWQNVTIIGTKTNIYTMWVTAEDNPLPWHYEMKGYNSLLGSHYDKYLIDYLNYAAEKINPEVFEIPDGLKCGGFPGPGAEQRILANPIKEYINNHDHHVHEMFESFKRNHDKEYVNKEHEERKTNFMHNVRFIHSSNRANKGFSLAVNHLADKTDKELTFMRGRLPRKGSNGGLPFNTRKYNITDVPDTLDWRLFGAVTPVKDQAVCGSCWSFGTTGTIEGALFLKTGFLVRLSQQNLVDCSWGFGNNGCDGGEEWRAYQWIMKHGLASEESYGPYFGADGYCHFENSSIAAEIKSYINVTSGDQQALKLAIAKYGPVAVGIDAAHKSLSFYSNGIYYEPQCGNKPENLDHAVLAVGYGTINGESYWLIKNSWSTYWGNDGYVLMSQKDNNCGVTTDATFVIM